MAKEAHATAGDWWRVHFHLWAAGGGLLEHWIELRADCAEDAIAKARLSHASTGYFVEATAEKVPR